MNRFVSFVFKSTQILSLNVLQNQRSFIRFNVSKRFIYFSRVNLDSNLPVNSNNNNNNNNEKNNNKQQDNFQAPKKEISPIRKLLYVKDYADFLILLFLATGIYIGYKNSKLRNEHEKRFNIEWISIPQIKHKIFKCSDFYLPEFLLKNLEKFKEFKLRKDDIWIASFPKSGTTWVQELVYLIENDCDFKKATQDSIENRSPFFDYPSPGLKYIENINSKRIIKTHLPLTFLPDNIENECKVIYILRNPKDVTVSYFHFTNLSTQAQFNGNFYDFSKLFIEGKIPYGPWWTHVDNYVTKKNVHVIFYEDLHEKPFEVIKNLAKFLDKSLNDNQIKSIIEWCSFDNMKTNPTVNYEWYKEIGLYKKNGNFFRKGKIGDWLNHFAVDDSQKIDDIVENKLKSKLKFNYGISDQDVQKIYSANK